MTNVGRSHGKTRDEKGLGKETVRNQGGCRQKKKKAFQGKVNP